MKNVLIVDDDPTLRLGLVKLVELNGNSAVMAASVAEGIKQLGREPSHVLLDMNLGDGRGTDILRHIREHDLPIRVAILSGSAGSSIMDEAKSLNPDAIFKKPTDWTRLLTWLNTD